MKKLNKEIEEKAKALNQWILDQEVVKEFQKYETLIHNNPDLLNTEEELKDIQKQIVNAKHQGIDCQKLIESYENKRKLFDENPIVYNYLLLKQEVNDLVKMCIRDSGIPMDQIMIWLATMISVISGIDYFMKNRQYIMESM